MPAAYQLRRRPAGALPSVLADSSPLPALPLSESPAAIAGHASSMGRRRSIDMADNTGSSSSGPVPATAWLHKPNPGSRSSHKSFLDNAKGDHFLALTRALREKDDITQECMLTKFYLFMRDFLPQGLVGAVGHIRGNDVMEWLLSHKGETAPSRHKATKQADVAFSKLELWMEGASNWREAQERATASYRAAEPEKRKKTGLRRLAPGLCSPAGILAVLIIAHPDDSKFRNWIVQTLQVDWMLQDRQTLDVRAGFWAGINAKNLYTVFARDEERESELPLLGDYSRLFGKDFVRAQRDIRPYLDVWAQELVQVEAIPEREERNGSMSSLAAPDSHAPNHSTFSSQDVLELRKCLFAGTEQDTNSLGQWLSKRLASGGDMISRWCQHWEKKIDNAENYQGQVIAHSLFRHSLLRLHSLSCRSIQSIESLAATQHPEVARFSASLDTLYIVLDMEMQDEEPKSPLEDAKKMLEIFRAIPVYKALEGANQHLARLAQASDSPSAGEQLQRLLDDQTRVLYNITTSSTSSDLFYGAIGLETLHTLVLVERAARMEQAQDIWSSTRDRLLSQEVVSTLMITRWQVQELLISGAKNVLTSWQDYIYRTKFCRGTRWELAENVDLEKIEPMPTSGQSWGFDVAPRWRRTLNKLLGSIETPEEILALKIQVSASPEPDAKTPTPTPAIPSPQPQSPVPTRSPRASLVEEHAPMDEASISTDPSCVHETSKSAGARGPPSTVPLIRNAFGIFNPARKRSGSPLDAVQPKIARLGFRTDLENIKRELSDDMKGHAQGLVAEIRAERGRLTVCLRDELTRVWKSEQKQLVDELREVSVTSWRAERKQLVADLVESMAARWASSCDHLRNDLQTDLAALKMDFGRVDAQLKELNANISTLMTVQHEHRANTEAGTKRLHQLLEERLGAVEAAITTGMATSRPGEDGYLTQDCPAPSGESQRGYESRLFRACLSYIYFLWDPLYNDDGVSQDCLALEETKKKFPELDEAHLVKALNQFHEQIFNHPLGHGDDTDVARMSTDQDLILGGAHGLGFV